MFVLRPITLEDFDALKQIAIESGHGFTSLPVDDEVLFRKIRRSEQSLLKDVTEPKDESYLFVLEDIETNEIVGTAAIESAVGANVPLYHYHLGRTVHHSRTLNVYNTVDILTMCSDYNGCSEICTLFLKEKFRKSLAGKFLSRSRFLFMAQHLERFSEIVIAEMRGVIDEDGHSLFWQWLQEHFFSIDFPEADRLVGLGDKVFISELMPRYPIYANLLSPSAQAVIGKVHKNTLPALKLLEKEGFENRGYVDLFDAGPTVEARLANIRTVRESKTLPCVIEKITGTDVLAICNEDITGFRSTFTQYAVFDDDNQQLKISPSVANALNVNTGDSIRFFTLQQAA